MTLLTELKFSVSDSFSSLLQAQSFESSQKKKKREREISNDVSIISSDRIEIPAHWFILRCRCDYFDACWRMKEYSNQNEDEKKRIDGSDFDSKTWFQVSFD